MAKNPKPSEGHRVGAVRDRSQFQPPSGNWAKKVRDRTGRILDVQAERHALQGRPPRKVARTQRSGRERMEALRPIFRCSPDEPLHRTRQTRGAGNTLRRRSSWPLPQDNQPPRNVQTIATPFATIISRAAKRARPAPHCLRCGYRLAQERRPLGGRRRPASSLHDGDPRSQPVPRRAATATTSAFRRGLRAWLLSANPEPTGRRANPTHSRDDDILHDRRTFAAAGNFTALVS